jgi:hypothetical protein
MTVPNDPQAPAPQAAELVKVALSESVRWSLVTEMLSVFAGPPGTALNELGLTITTAGLLDKFTIVVPGVEPVRLDEIVSICEVAELTLAGGVY